MYQTLHNAEFEEQKDRIVLEAGPLTDYIVSPQTGTVTACAPFVFRRITGDFTLQARVSHAFASTYDAACLMALESDTKWIKACFEKTAEGARAVVSVATDGCSDDANGPEFETDAVWLRLARKGDVFTVHYALDGVRYKKQRICRLNLAPALKVGFLAQCPKGDGAVMTFREPVYTENP